MSSSRQSRASLDAIVDAARAQPRGIDCQPGVIVLGPPSSLLPLSLHAIGASAIETPRRNKTISSLNRVMSVLALATPIR
jgi:hypothetical protein